MIHDWGSFLGYQFMHLYPSLMTRVVSFDIGSGGHPNVTYQAQNNVAWAKHDSAIAQQSAAYWCAPCVDCAVSPPPTERFGCLVSVLVVLLGRARAWAWAWACLVLLLLLAAHDIWVCLSSC